MQYLMHWMWSEGLWLTNCPNEERKMEESYYQDPIDESLREEADNNHGEFEPFLVHEITQVKEELEYLRDLFVRRLNDDKQKNLLIQNATDGATFAYLEPFLHDIILLLDRLEKVEDDFSESVKEELYDIFHRRGLTRIHETNSFDPNMHKAVRVIENENTKEMYIDSVVRNGYIFSGKVIRPAEVVVVCPRKENES